ncbi:MAG: HAD family hydrolase [Ignavibacteriae bacterium]|nr:MAG: HAD family hydrolase [Ignavibacteriota bacterium]
MKCYHCGEPCRNHDITIEDKVFCCNGCKLVYEILEENKLCKYYSLDEKPGISQSERKINTSGFAYLDDEQIQKQLLDFTDGKISSISFFIPQMHCSSCIWLLENMYKLNPAIFYSQVNFPEKKLSVRFKENEISLRKIVELLASIGYEPQISLNEVEDKVKSNVNKRLYYRIGVAGFCFGNIMLLSFPEYLSFDDSISFFYKNFFGLLNILLSIPVILYCSSDYFKSAYTGIKQKTINIDFPISLGLAVLFIRSVIEILTNSGPGFFDSLSGLVFFLLAGKVFQSKTYDALNFERNYKSYFPLSVTIKKSGEEQCIPVSKLKVGDRIIIRNNELIPGDAILFNGTANIDYSFVTGESIPVGKVAGEIIYAGGRQTGSAIELEVIRTVSQSYLTQLWNNETFVKRDEDKFKSLVNVVGKYFTIVIILVAALAFVYWYPTSIKAAINAFTAVLIIACPCGIALTSPFALGNAMRILGRNKFYVKNTSVVERMSKIDTIVFDKTGTITKSGDSNVNFSGGLLTSFEQRIIKSLARNSTHPLSIKICDAIKENELFETNSFIEHIGKGIGGKIGYYDIRLGSRSFVLAKEMEDEIDIVDMLNSKVYLSINNKLRGYFVINNIYREGFEEAVNSLKHEYDLSVLSGDNEGEKENLLRFFDDESQLLFKQKPEDKLQYIKKLQGKGKKVMMLGDGLNDAGGLKQSDVGIAISEDVSSFSPACDAILDASMFSNLVKFIQFSISTKRIIITSFIISVIYNILGVTLAFQNTFSPLAAAILMPISSITVVLFTVSFTNLSAKRRGL